MDDHEFQALKAGVAKEAPPLIPLLELFESMGKTDYAPKPYWPLLRALASKSPVCAYIHPTLQVKTIVEYIIGDRKEGEQQQEEDQDQEEGEQKEEEEEEEDVITDGSQILGRPFQMRDLQKACPILFDVVKEVKEVKTELKDLLRSLLILSENPFTRKVDIKEEDAPTDEPKGSFFPSLPYVRQRGKYTQDETKNSPDESKCRPESTKGHRSLLPGLFLLFCSHGKLTRNYYGSFIIWGTIFLLALEIKISASTSYR